MRQNAGKFYPGSDSNSGSNEKKRAASLSDMHEQDKDVNSIESAASVHKKHDT